MKAGVALLATLVLVFTSVTLQVLAEDLYWEGEEEASNEFLEVKDEDLGIGGHLRRLKRGFWDIFSDTSSTTEKPESSPAEQAFKDDLGGGDDDFDNDIGSGFPDRDRPDTELEPREKTLRVTFMVNQPYRPEYNKRDSYEFKNFSTSLSNAVNQLYDQLPGTQRASLVRIQSRTSDDFTCKVTLDIVTTGYDDTNYIASILHDHIRNRRALGSVAVSDSDFSANVIDPGSAIDVCAADEMTCSDGSCVPGSTRCNGYRDCSDGSDEEGCPALTDSWNQETESATEYEPDAEATPDQTVSSRWMDNNSGETNNGDIDEAESDDLGNPFDQTTSEYPETTTSFNNPARMDHNSGETNNGDIDEPERGDLGNSFDQTTSEYPETTTSFNNSTTCHNDELRCDETRCVPLLVRCDGSWDCYDGADEKDCQEICGPDDYRCRSNGRCLESNRRCDGLTDCPDGDDEMGCNCRSDEFTCVEDRSCIELRKVCDGTPNCGDRSDELHCGDWTGHHVCKDRGKFRCRDGTCISVLLRCDGFRDCARDGSDEIGCPCSSDQWQCDHGNCIKRSQRCDGRVDCPTDRSDERFCFARNFRCASGKLIPEHLRCNHRYDCPAGDYSDERNCPCGVADFKCANGYCITASKRCDRTHDCQDGSDERDCSYGTECMAYEYKCTSGQCVRADSVCNGTAECDDGSDERNCPCKRGAFYCRDGTCINIALRCNGHRDCRNGEDELNCHAMRCPEFTCNPDSSVRCAKQCDGRVECSQGEDEENCEGCNHYCKDGRCVKDQDICNGIQDCDDGSDELHCDDCDGPKDFRCKTSLECLNIAQQCNGVAECADYTDELNCNETVTPAPHGCPESMFQCGDGSCINGEFYCDGRPDCLDRTDEDNCPWFLPRPSRSPAEATPCHESEFTCYDGRCIPHLRRCDNIYDCMDFSDEQNCYNSGCKSDEWACDNGQCIALYEHCDGTPHCTDGSDERNCMTTRAWFTTTPSYPEQPYQPPYQPPYQQPYQPPYQPPYRPEPPTTRSPYYPTTAYPPYPNPYPPSSGSSEGCDRNEWRCENGPCIDTRRRCDGIVDCPFDSSDEFDCPPDNAVRLKTYPEAQSVRNGGDVVFRCRDESDLRAPVRWVRQDGRPFKPGSSDKNGRLEMIRVSPADSGTYICQAIGYGIEARVQLTVDNSAVVPSNPSPQVPACQPHQATCGNGECVPKSAICDGNADCSDGTDEESCNLNGMCEPNQFQCDNRKCVLKTWLCDSENDCGDNSDEMSCGPSVARPGECLPVEFRCETGAQCVPKSFQCDGQSDCLDLSDEKNCAPVHVTKPPAPSNVRLNPGDTLTLACEAVGTPIPLISWRLNWGHVPQNCTSTSEGGRGMLTCHNMQPQDSGAYSCEAINNRGTAFGDPDAIVYVNRTDVCPNGYFNSEARAENECIRCFCFGESTQCRSADLYTYNMPTPLGQGGTRLVGVKQSYNGQIQIDSQPITDKYYYSPLIIGATVTKVENYGPSSSYGSESHPYLTLPETYNGNQLTSYGGHIRYRLAPHSPRYNRDDGLPDIIIKGKYETLVHRYRGDKSREFNLETRLTPENWQKVGPSGLGPASREDIMMALDNIEMILLRADLNNAGVNITHFTMESAQHANVFLGAANLVEECTCPPGYEGLSCQKCAPGYVREKSGPWLGNCVREQRPCPPGTYGDPGSGYGCRPCPCPLTNPENNFARTCSVGSNGRVICDCAPGYGGETCEYCEEGYIGNPLIPGNSCQLRPTSRCDQVGTLQQQPFGECLCKDNVQGPYCDQCKDDSYYLSQDFRHGCALCFCSGVSQQCKSSNLRRKTTSARFNTLQIVRQLQVYSTAQQGPAGNVRYNAPEETNLTPTLQRGHIALDSVDRGSVYYWSLPANFAGDKVTSYGGFLTYTLSNVAPSGPPTSRNNAADVQLLSDNRLTFHYYSNAAPSSDGTLNASVQFLEKGWQRADGKEITREHFLLALADVKAILIKATYSSYSELASLESASIETAELNGNGPRALHVEQCVCPTGYIGTSCEDCAPGYTRSSSGLYLEHCEPCDCNGHSSSCHPESGVCYDCNDNTAGENCELCKPGFVKNQYDMCEPSYATTPRVDCSCDPRGAAGPCDYRGVCPCKQNVQGEYCDSCRPGTFGLDRNEPLGCLSCYCSGVTTDCHEAGHYSRIEMPLPVFGPDYSGYKITNLNGEQFDDRFVPDPNESELLYSFPYQPTTALYWSLPSFPGNRLLSYGGVLSLTQKFESNDESELSAPDTDVVLVGDAISVYWSNPTPMRSGEALSYQVPLRENGWYLLNSAIPANRNDFMAVLKDLKRVLVRATLSENIMNTAIADVSMDTAVANNPAATTVAKGIEMCMCPEGYTGTSCESCAQRYYLDPSNVCRQCPCNGHDCTISANNEVMCNCRPPYSGRDCSTVGVVMELMPTIHKTADPYNPLRKITLTCKYRAPEPLTIRFYYEGREVNPPKYYYESTQHHDGYHGEHAWRTVWDMRRREETFSCHTLTARGFTLGVLTTTLPQTDGSSNTLDGTTRPPPPESTVVVRITSPTIKIEEVGSSVNFTCQARSQMTSSRLPVQWTKYGGELPQGRYQVDRRTGLLLITNLQISDSGTYICQTNDGVSTAQATATLRVPGINMTLPVITLRPTSSNYYVGDRVELECLATGNPMPRITWQRTGNYPLPRGVSSVDSRLIIDNVMESDSGEYRCIAMNAAGSTDRVAIVNVRPKTPSYTPQDKLTVSPTSANINEGQTIRFVCTGTSNIPAGTIDWMRDDRVEFLTNVRNDQGVLYINYARPENQGLYTCQASSPDISPVSVLLTVIPLGTAPPSEQPAITVTQNQTKIATGDSGSVDCIPHGFPQPLIRWEKYDGEFGPGVSQRDNTLIISNAQESDAGYYVCKGLVDGTPIDNQIYVYIEIIRRIAPVVQIWPQGEQAVALNSQFELHCRVMGGVPDPDITWSRSGGRPLSQHTHIQKHNVLKFDKIEVNDEGEYQCVARNEAGESLASAVLKVRSPPEISITPSSYLEVVNGDSVTVECRAFGYPEPMVSISTSTDRREVVSPAPGVAMLHINAVSDRDEGEYVCTAVSAAGTIDEQFVIRVDRGDGGFVDTGSGESEFNQYPYNSDDNEPAAIIAHEGEDAKIECNASDGFMVVWRRVDNQPLQVNAIQSGSALLIRNASKKDSGQYECTVINRYTNEVQQAAITNLQVVAPPRITLQPKTQTVHPGQSPTVECRVDGDDIIDVSWRGNHGRPLPRRVESRGPNLIFHQIEVEDAGQYECVARNRYANVTAFAEVIVSAESDRAPSESHDHEQYAHVEDAVHLSCNVSQLNLKISWTKDGRRVPASRQNDDGSLSIRRAQKSDSGLYICNIRDRYGRKTSDYINLHIEGPRVEASQFVSIDQPRRQFRVGDNVEVLCRANARGITVSWVRYDNELPQYVPTRTYGDGSMLLVTGVQETDAGVYRCTGHDAYGRTSQEDFNLEVIPVVIVPSRSHGDQQEYTAHLGDTVDMPCNHDLELPVMVEWRREYSALPPEVRRDEPNLHLEHVTEADAGTYVCRVSNSHVAVESRAVLRVKGVVPRFDGNSWLALPTIPDAYRQFDIEISFNPSDPDGLILYNTGENNDFVALQLVDSVPKFTFDANSGPVVASGDRPLQLNTWHTIRISKIDSKVTMDVDNTGPFVSDSLKWDVLELDQPLYIGGVPDYSQLPSPLAGATGFIGCVSLLILGREEKDIMVVKTEEYNIQECDTCAPNLCLNNGVCQETRNERGYMCLCAAGFAGLNCDRTGQACRPGLCGPGKCSDTADGYKCHCPVAYTGQNCDVRQQIEYPAFTGSAYLAIKPPETSRLFQMSLKIKASSPVTDGIIMYCAASSRGYGAFTSLAVREGKLEYRYDLGDRSAPVVLTSNHTLPPNEWTAVHIARIGKSISLKINTNQVYEQLLESPSKDMRLETPMFVGGVDDSIVLNNNTGVTGGFNGCIKDVTVSNRNVNIVNSSIQSANVQECSNFDRGDIPEIESVCSQCRNGGQCIGDATTCTCPVGFTGAICETRAPLPARRPGYPPADACAARPCRNNGICRSDPSSRMRYTCDCPLGFAGANCQIHMELLESVGFSGNGYLELPAALLRYDRLNSEPVVIALAFHTTSDGVLLYQGETDSLYGDHILLRVEQGLVVLDWDLGSGHSTLVIDDIHVSDGERHGVVVQLNGDATVELMVDRMSQKTGTSTGLTNLMNADSNIYIGGIPEKYNRHSYPGLTGCIEQVELTDTRRSLILGEHAVAGWNAQRCKDPRS